MLQATNKYHFDCVDHPYDPERLFTIAIKNRHLWQTWAEAGHARMGYDVLRIPHRIPYLDELSSPFATSDEVFPIQRMLFTRFPPNYNLPMHRDVGAVETGPRQCAMVFSITPRPTVAPISWHDDDGKVVEQHSYNFNFPTLINTQELHSVSNSNQERICFQLSFYEPFDVLARRLSER